MVKRHIYFRADGSTQMGLGHLFRAAAIAQSFDQTAFRTLLTRCDNTKLLEQFAQYFDSIEVIPVSLPPEDETKLVSLTDNNPIIVLDGYHFVTDYQQRWKDYGFKVVSIDDIHNCLFVSDIVINHAEGIDISQYKLQQGTKLFTGFQYAIVRNNFTYGVDYKKRNNNACFICLGGADPGNETLKILKALPDTTTGDVVVGNGYIYLEELKKYIDSCKKSIQLHVGVDVTTMKELMERNGKAICSPSTVVLEFLHIGGELYIVPIADNQLFLHKYLIESGLAFPIQHIGTYSVSDIKKQFQQQKAVFDGKSMQRVKEIILNE